MTPEDDAQRRHWLLTLAYVGSAYHGWQRQPDQPTVQAALERGLERLFRVPVPTAGCSRTDSGVHALAQQVSLEAPAMPPIPAPNARIALNNLLPADLHVRRLDPMPPGFHVQRAVVGKAYTYLLHRGEIANPFVAPFCLRVPERLDLSAMRVAAAALLGCHDFTAFSVTSSTDAQRDPRKTLHRVDVATHGRLLAVTVVGDSFLYKMVRRLVGFLLAVGEGRLSPAGTGAILASADRNQPFQTAPAHGLCLHEVFFDQAALIAWRPRELPFLHGLELRSAPDE